SEPPHTHSRSRIDPFTRKPQKGNTSLSTVRPGHELIPRQRTAPVFGSVPQLTPVATPIPGSAPVAAAVYEVEAVPAPTSRQQHGRAVAIATTIQQGMGMRRSSHEKLGWAQISARPKGEVRGERSVI